MAETEKKEAIKSKFYNNIRILSPSGEEMGFCPTRKINWYLERELADLIVDSENETSHLQLHFEPKGRHVVDTEYYLSPINEECVVCGSSIHLLQHSIIPNEFRDNLPEFMKQHLCHDFILSCIQCHHKLLQVEEEYVELLGRRYNCRFERKMIFDDDVQKVMKACVALQKHMKKNYIPELRKHTLEETIKNYFRVDVITPEIISIGVQLNGHGIKTRRPF